METVVTLHIERAGSGPPVVLAHGFGGSSRNFRKNARALTDAYTVVTYDARGHGRSARPDVPEAYRFARLVADFKRVAESSGSAPVVGGVSLGAYTALAYALEAATRPRALIIAAYPAPRTNPARVRWATEFAQAIEEEGLDAAGARFVWGPDSRFDEKSAALIRLGFLEHSPIALAAIAKNVLTSIEDPEARKEELARLDVPALLVAGSEDADAIAAADSLARLLPRATRVVLPGAGHLVNLQAADAFNATVRTFLDGLDST